MTESINDYLRSIRHWLARIVYLSLGLSWIFSFLYLANYLDVRFFVLANRGMLEQSIVSSLFSPIWDTAVWALSICVVLVWMLYQLKSKIALVNLRVVFYLSFFAIVGLVVGSVFGFVSLVWLVLASFLLSFLCFLFSGVLFGLSKVGLFLRVIVGGLFFVLFIELAALVLSNAPLALNLNLPLFDLGLHWNSVELSLSYLAYPLLPYIYLLFVLMGIVAFGVDAFSFDRLIVRIKNSWLGKINGRLANLFDLGEGFGLGFIQNRLIIISLVGSAIVSCLFVLFTVLPWANPTGMLVSVDSPSYYQWIDHMRSVDFNSAMSFAFSNDRALFLILAYALSFFASPVVVVQLVSAILLVTLGVVTFLLLRLVCNVREVWVLGALLVPFSFQGLGLIYSGYFANMLALILVFVYVILFFRLVNNWSVLGFLGLLIVSVGVLFSHSWTWFVFAASLLLFLFLEWRSLSSQGIGSGRFRIMGLFIGSTLAVGLLCDFSRRLLGPVSSSGSVLGTVQSSLGLPNLGFLISELGDTVDFILGGVYARFVLIFLAIVGFLVLLRFKTGISRFFVSWVFVGCVSILFATESFVFDRFLFLMPWIVFCALGLFFIVNCCVKGFGRWRFWVVLLFLTVFFLSLINWSLGYIFNINIW